MSKQKTLRFTLNRRDGELAVNHRISEEILNHKYNLETKKPGRDNVAQCLKCSMLKKLARRAMAAVTDCPPDTIGAHVARLDDLIEIIGLELRHDLKETPEATMGQTPLKPYTVAEYLFCLTWTKQQHRAPAFMSQRDEDISQINRKLDMLAGLLSKNPEALELFQRQFNDAQLSETEAA